MLRDYHYHVLRVRVDRQFSICSKLADVFPKERGHVFLPKWEYYRRDKKAIDTKPLFPGYIFIHTEMKRSELMELLRSSKTARPVRNYLLGEDKEGVADLWEDSMDSFLDLTESEEEFFDQILDEEGVERMSRGYCDPEAVVMEGPLKPFADTIVKLDKRNWLAWLDINIHGEPIKAGLQILLKSTWYPEEGNVSQHGELSENEEEYSTEREKAYLNSLKTDGGGVAENVNATSEAHAPDSARKNILTGVATDTSESQRVVIKLSETRYETLQQTMSRHITPRKKAREQDVNKDADKNVE